MVKHVIEFKTPATPKMEIFVTLVDGWRPQANGTKSFIWDVAMVLDMKQLLQLIKNIEIDLFFMISTFNKPDY